MVLFLQIWELQLAGKSEPMCGFEEACKEALGYLKQKNDNVGLAEIGDLPDRWIFIGYGGGPYGSIPVTVMKSDGTLNSFSLALVENQDLYYDVSVPVPVPDEFR